MWVAVVTHCNRLRTQSPTRRCPPRRRRAPAVHKGADVGGGCHPLQSVTDTVTNPPLPSSSSPCSCSTQRGGCGWRLSPIAIGYGHSHQPAAALLVVAVLLQYTKGRMWVAVVTHCNRLRTQSPTRRCPPRRRRAPAVHKGADVGGGCHPLQSVTDTVTNPPLPLWLPCSCSIVGGFWRLLPTAHCEGTVKASSPSPYSCRTQGSLYVAIAERERSVRWLQARYSQVITRKLGPCRKPTSPPWPPPHQRSPHAPPKVWPSLS